MGYSSAFKLCTIDEQSAFNGCKLMSVVATVDDYLHEAGALDKAMLPLGFFLAFCAHHRLLSQEFTRQRAEQLSAVRRQEGQVTTLFAAHGATLYASDFTPQGLVFVRGYLPQLYADFAQTFEPACFEIDDDWSNYQQLANVMIRHLLGQPRSAHTSRGLWSTIKTRVAMLWR